MSILIPDTAKKRVVIVGGGFAGINLVKQLDETLFQTVLIDRNNYHQFPPLLYQVASSGLEADSICFPFRKEFQRKKDFYFRLAEVTAVDLSQNILTTSIGELRYDYLVMAMGTTTNYFGNEHIRRQALPMKSVEEALQLRNTILTNFENSLNTPDFDRMMACLNIVVVGGGATGVEIAGSLSEMKRFIVPKDYPDLYAAQMNVYLVEGNEEVLHAMSPTSAAKAGEFLSKMGVKLLLGRKVTDYKDDFIYLDDGSTIATKTVVWVSGVTANRIEGFPDQAIGHAGRLLVDEYNRVKTAENVYAIGDVCMQEEPDYPKGHPQVAPVAIQQGRLLAANLKALQKQKQLQPFRYHDKGTLATIGRNKAVADLPKTRLSGFPAWVVWLLVHLHYILGARKKLAVLLDWIWNYFSYNNSERLIIFVPKKEPSGAVPDTVGNRNQEQDPKQTPDRSGK